MIKFAELCRGALLAGLAASFLQVAGCVSETSKPAVQADSNAQPRQARYDCGEDGLISVENRRTAVRLVEESSGEFYDLPASPPTQANRYGEGGYALVVEGREALWMKGNDTPMACRR